MNDMINKEVANIGVDLQWLPKLGLAKKRIDRKAIMAGVKAGNKYVIPFTVNFTDNTTWSSNFTIVKMFRDEFKRDIVMVEEDKLGQFGILFNSLMSGAFKGELQGACNKVSDTLNNAKKQFEYAIALVQTENEQLKEKYKKTILPIAIKLAQKGKSEMEIISYLAKQGLI